MADQSLNQAEILAEVQNSGGRPPALDETKRRKILALLANGSSRRVAARIAGCAHSTIARTAQRDPQFAAELDAAEHNSDGFAPSTTDNHQWPKRAWDEDGSSPVFRGQHTEADENAALPSAVPDARSAQGFAPRTAEPPSQPEPQSSPKPVVTASLPTIPIVTSEVAV